MGTDMTSGNPYSLLLRFSLPLVAGNLFWQCYSFADTLIVSRKLGALALAALGVTEWLNFLVFGIVTGATQGFSIPIAGYYGAGEKEKLMQSLVGALTASAIGAVLLTVLGQFLAVPALRLLKTPDELLVMAALYLRILFAGIPIAFAYHMASAILRAFGNGKAPFYAMAVSSVANLLLDILFVAGLDLGIGGASFATVLSWLLAFLYLYRVLFNYREGFWETKTGGGFGCPKKRKKFYHRSALMECLRIGVPMGFQNVITASGGLVVQRVCNGFGVYFLAGYTAANKLYVLLETAASSYGYAISTYTAQNKGAGKVTRIGKGIRAALVIGMVSACMMSVVMFVFGKPILGLFLQNREENIAMAIEIGYRFLCVLAVFFPCLYIVYILRSSVQGLGNSTLPMLSGLVQAAMRIFCACVLAAGIGYTGIFYGEISAWIGADLFLTGILLRQYKKIIAAI